jgi:hypothetical protein
MRCQFWCMGCMSFSNYISNSKSENKAAKYSVILWGHFVSYLGAMRAMRD